EREQPSETDLEATQKWQQIMEQVHGKAEVIIGKQRHGPIGSVPLAFEDKFTRFSDLAYSFQADQGFN
ncbi:MAG: DnaB-like helicase C-terminal domain-containing protein, partial [Pseudomonadota bacterium]